MKTLDIKQALKSVPLFSDLDEAELTQLAELCKLRRLRKDGPVFYEDDPGTTCYVMLSGKVKVAISAEDGREHILGILSEGDVFGEVSLIDGKPRSASAFCIEEAQALTIQREEFLQLLMARPAMALKVMVVLSERLRAATTNLESLAFLSAPGRIARLLLELAKAGEPTPEGLALPGTMSRQDFASIAGTSRETVTRVLMDFQDRGLILVDKNRVTIKNRDKLEDLVV